MSSRKTERQLDLLFILLNSMRSLTREQIREKIQDYRTQDSQESFERMFERDKEELRGAGIPIETKQLDPLFEDEYGYSLDLQNFSYQASNFTSAELTELTRAALIWEDATLAANARLGLVKSHTATGNDINFGEEFNIQHLISSHHYVVITTAIVNKKIVEFLYLKPQDSQPSRRRVFPVSVISQNSTVYLSALDLNEKKSKTFSFARISGEVLTFEANSEEMQLAKKEKVQTDSSEKKYALITPLNSLPALQHEIGGVAASGNLSIEFFDEVGFAVFLAPFAFQIADIEPKSLKELVAEHLILILKKIS